MPQSESSRLVEPQEDIAAKLSAIMQEFSGWRPWVSDAGRWWATRLGAQPAKPPAWWAITVDADDSDKLREAITEQERLESVNGLRILTLWRHLNSDPLPVSLVFGCLGGHAAQVAVLEAVAVSLQVDDLGVVDEAIMAAATTSSPNTSPQRPNGLLLVTMRVALSYLAETSWKNRLAASASNGM